MRKRSLLLLCLIIVIMGFFSYRVKIKNLFSQGLISLWLRLDLNKEEIPAAIEYKTIDNLQTQNESLTIDDEKLSDIPKLEINLDVPFTSQAPTANWDETFKEACEEASIIMVDRFYKNQGFKSPETTEEEILKAVAWQKNYFGGHFDLTASQTAQMIKEYFGYKKVEMIDNPTVGEIKILLNDSRPVIVPAAGQLLGNPYFRRPGPIYHMLVIKGYAQNKFITNDPGTKRGKDYLYDFDVLMSAMHDWDPVDINNGAKRIIVIYPN